MNLLTVSASTYVLDELNEIFLPLTFAERIAKLYEHFDEEKVMFSSSFGTKSVFLLHLMSQIRPTQKVHFINTGYHFPETLQYKQHLKQLLDISIIEINPASTEHQITEEEKWWNEHPKMCCTINKIAPLDPVIAQNEVWISGLMSFQTSFRSRLKIFERQGDIIKFHPLIDIDEGEFLYHLDYYRLPHHPLESKGYGSVGCIHCTKKGQGRSGRWANTGITECGLHPHYFTKKLKVKSISNS